MPSLNNKKLFFEGQKIILIFRGLIPIVILAGGVVILALRIPGWSLLLGLPVTIMGVVFLIGIFDDLVRQRVGIIPEEPELTVCSVCGETTPKLLGVATEDTICYSCTRKIKAGIKQTTADK